MMPTKDIIALEEIANQNLHSCINVLHHHTLSKRYIFYYFIFIRKPQINVVNKTRMTCLESHLQREQRFTTKYE